METSPCSQEEDVQEERESLCAARVFKPSGVSGGGPGDAVAKSRDYWSGLKRHGVVGRSLLLVQVERGAGLGVFSRQREHMAVE